MNNKSSADTADKGIGALPDFGAMFAGVADGAARAVGGAAQVAGDVVQSAGGALQDAGKVVGDAVGSFMPKDDGARRGNIKDSSGAYIMPEPIVDAREQKQLGELSDRYDELTRPGVIEKAGDAVVGLLPDAIKGAAKSAAQQISEQELIAQTLKIASEGFGSIEKIAASVTITEGQVLDALNGAYDQDRLSSLDEVCLLRAYDIARVVNGQGVQHTVAALFEGGVTGAAGFPGIPFSIVLSTFLYYRAVQTIAMYYGYDVKNDASELVIAGEVFSASLAPRGADLGGGLGLIGKVMAISEAATVGQVIKKGWLAMAQHGGACLLIAQMRALANAAARRALERAGKGGLEHSVFRSMLEQIGRRLPQKSVQRAVPFVGGAIGALFDAGQMQRVLAIANAFYHKRFIIEKEMRVESLVEHLDLNAGFTDEAIKEITASVE